jgi:hypothetical protein
LFNSNDLSGWYTWLVDSSHDDPRRVFSVAQQQIRISGDGLGYLATSNEFRNYTLSLEFRWGTNNTRWGHRIGKARDSGVFLHATGPDGNSHDGNGAFMAAIECNIFQGATGDFLLIRGSADGKPIAPRVTVETAAKRDRENWPWWQPGGGRTNIERWGRVNWRHKSADWRDELNFRGARDVERSYGEWNQLEITCDGEHIEVVLNGSKVNEAFAVWPNQGRILLQCEGSEIFFRRIILSPVKGK